MERRHEYFDVSYSLASVALTSGETVVATTGADYHGIAIVASATKASVYVYDNASTASGTLVDRFVVAEEDSVWIDRSIPVKAKNGLVVKIVGAGADGTIFYNPKG